MQKEKVGKEKKICAKAAPPSAFYSKGADLA